MLVILVIGKMLVMLPFVVRKDRKFFRIRCDVTVGF